MDNQFQNCTSTSCFWDNSSMDNQTDPLDTALSSMVSSPTAISNPPQNLNLLRELIGRLGTICNSAEISPPHHQIGISNFSSDPGFVERAARFSSFKFNPRSDNSLDNYTSPSVQESLFTPENVEFGDSRENSSVSEQIPPLNSRKRKSDIIPKRQGKTKETAKPAAAAYVASENSESVAKRSKSEDENEKNKSNKASSSSASKDKSPAPKDYIHVRARRGQATDAHSLAERVRREKISERMKFLQDLVPGCNKVTGKAVMLDEIINYVQSLQRQVEFLSMKLAAVNPRTEFSGVSASKDASYNMHHHSSDSSSYHHFPSQLLMIPRGANQVDNFGGSQAYWEDDLHSFVQMGFGQTNNTNGAGGIRMKVEL